MQRRYVEDPAAATPDSPDPMLQVLSRRGGEHETAYLEALKAAGRAVRMISREAGAEETRRALVEGIDVIYQAPLAGHGFAGFADFLVRYTDDAGASHYGVWDTKLSRQPKPYFIIQLCCYADMLELMTGDRPSRIGVILGNGEEHRFRTSDFFFYYQHVRAAFLDLMARFPGDGPPEPESNGNHGIWAGEARRWQLARDDLSQVANISRGQIARLRAAGVHTLTALAGRNPGHVRGIGDEVLLRLHRQAALQLGSRGKERPDFTILPPPADNPTQGLAALPPAAAGDVFFDMEGYPAAGDWLEYLFGAVILRNGEPEFLDWWAHDSVEERRAFEAFIDWAYSRWRDDPAMHIYHYAAYEPAALKRLMSRYGSREDEVDAFLRAGVFVDLYNVVRRGLLVGEPAYSLKNVEHLYREARAGDVQDAATSVQVYDQWCESGEPRDWRQSPLLQAIRDYNRDDCVSTWQLVGWLRARQGEAGIAYTAAHGGVQPEAEGKPLSAGHEARRQLAQALLATLPPEGVTDAAARERRRVQELLAWLVEFHRRNDKPMWWQHFDRQEMTVTELYEDMDCLADLVAEGDGSSYRFDPRQDTKLHEGDTVSFVPDIGIEGKIEEFDLDGRLTLAVNSRKLKSLGRDALPARTSLTPFEYVNPKPIQESISRTAEYYQEKGELPPALGDFLSRRRPRLKKPYAGPLRRSGEGVADAAIRLALDLDNSCLCLQGPPGTGKTYTAARMIIALLQEGFGVGITSNSHKAILNLMREVCLQGGPQIRATKVGGADDDPVLMEFPQIAHVAGAKDAAGAYPGQVVGGTAWFFSVAGMADQLDYLFVDEAGQVSLANLVGVARSARNLVLLGDQMQLGQPIQGVHPGESGLSVLDYYLQDHATIPPDLGIFLDTSWRMHPDVCRFISEAVYEGRLAAEPGTSKRLVQLERGAQVVTRSAGLLFVPVEHVGNVQGSDEEVGMIQRIVRELARCSHSGKDGKCLGRIDVTRDVLVVAPYNLQVRKLRQALPPGMRVGSVDKFQGQEAPVVIVSMCASPGEFGTRGLKFVLDQNRMNVAISRAQSLAIVVGDPRLADAGCTSIDDMKRLNLYCWIQREGSAAAPC